MKSKNKKENYNDCCDCHGKSGCNSTGIGCGVYGIGYIGAAIYYIQQATGFWSGVWGLIKALAWPAILVYKLIGF